MQTTRNFLPTFFIFIMFIMALPFSGILPPGDCAADAAPNVAGQCVYTLAPASQAVAAPGGTFSVAVTTASGCNWTATSNDSWITITSGGGGSGNGAVNYTVAAYTGATSRVGTMTIAGQTFTVTQGFTCPVGSLNIGQFVSGELNTGDCNSPISGFLADRYSFSGGAGAGVVILLEFPAGRTPGRLNLIDSSGMVIASASTSGPTNSPVRLPTGSGFFSLPANGTYTIEASSPIAGAGYKLSLSGGTPGCNYSLLTSGSRNFAASGGTGSVLVTTDSACAWTAFSDVSWITINGGVNRTGEGTVNFTVAASADPRLRAGAILIAGQPFSVSQYGTGSDCTVTPISFGQSVQGSIQPTDCISPLKGGGVRADRYSFDATAGSGASILIHSVNLFGNEVTLIDPGGAIIASSSSSSPESVLRLPAAGGFLSLPTSGRHIIEVTIPSASGVGDYTLSLNAGTPGCSYSLAADRGQAPFHGGGNGSVAVTTGAGCAWTAHGEANWITIASGANGAGNGTAIYRTAANPSPTPRVGQVRVAAQLRDVVQYGNPDRCAVTPAIAGQTVNGMSTPGGCYSTAKYVRIGAVTFYTRADRYTFTAAAGVEVSITLQSSAFRPYLYLFGPNGVVAAEAGSTGASAPYTARIPATGVFKLPASGTYFIEATTAELDIFSGAYTLNLSGCVYTVSPAARIINAEGGPSSVNVSVPNDCPAWTATSNTSWITINSGSSGSGNGVVNFTVAPNTSVNSRSGALTVAGQTVTITQAGLITSVSAASFLGTALAPESIVAAFGAKLATEVRSVTTTPLPTTLAGTTARVKDSAGVERPAQLFFVSPAQVNFLMPAGLANGAATVTVTGGDGSVSTGVAPISATAPGMFAANANGQGVAAGVALRVKNTNPVPAISGLSPNSAVAGGQGFTLTVNGSNFINRSVVRWNGNDRPTMFVSATQLRAAIGAADIASTGAAMVTVFNPEPGGGQSNALNFSINNPSPSISGLSHAFTTSGDPGFRLTVNGSNFIPGSAVRWNGSDRMTTFVSASRLTAEILDADISAPGAGSVTVFNPPPGGGQSSARTITIFDGTRDVRLTSGAPHNDSFSAPPPGTPPGACSIRIFPQYTIQVPPGATQLRITLSSSENLDIFARYAQRVDAPSNLVFDYSSTGPGGSETITVTPSSVPPLQGGKFFIAAGSCARVAADFTLTATVTGGLAADPLTTTPEPDDPSKEDDEAKDKGPLHLFYPKPSESESVPPGLAVLPLLRDGNLTWLPGGVETALQPSSSDVEPAIETAISKQPSPGFAATAIPLQGGQTFEPIVVFDQTLNRFVAIPIDLGPATDDVYLILYGTGIRLRGSLGAVTASVGGASVPVLFAGQAPGFFGLDQINLGPLPRSLAGRGEVDVVLTVEGKTTNTVKVHIR